MFVHKEKFFVFTGAKEERTQFLYSIRKLKGNVKGRDKCFVPETQAQEATFVDFFIRGGTKFNLSALELNHSDDEMMNGNPHNEIPYGFNQSEIAVYCFPLDQNKSRFVRFFEKWHKFIRQYTNNMPIVLVACGEKIELFYDQSEEKEAEEEEEEKLTFATIVEYVKTHRDIVDFVVCDWEMETESLESIEVEGGENENEEEGEGSGGKGDEAKKPEMEAMGEEETGEKEGEEEDEEKKPKKKARKTKSRVPAPKPEPVPTASASVGNAMCRIFRALVLPDENLGAKRKKSGKAREFKDESIEKLALISRKYGKLQRLMKGLYFVEGKRRIQFDPKVWDMLRESENLRDEMIRLYVQLVFEGNNYKMSHWELLNQIQKMYLGESSECVRVLYRRVLLGQNRPKYVGMLNDKGEMHGIGKELFASGKLKFVGRFEENLRHGKESVLYREDGSIEREGEWRCGDPFGYVDFDDIPE